MLAQHVGGGANIAREKQQGSTVQDRVRTRTSVAEKAHARAFACAIPYERESVFKRSSAKRMDPLYLTYLLGLGLVLFQHSSLDFGLSALAL